MTTIAAYNAERLIGTQVGTSIIIKELARGGMAIVFIAFQKSLKRQIAVKVLPKSLITAKSAELFQQEAEAVAILSHPNIIPVYEVGETDEFLFITMQLVQGNTLAQYMQFAQKNPIPSRRVLPLPAALRVMIQMLDALDYAHSQGIVHRDIKPGNIMIEKHSRRPLVTDFGIVQVLNSSTEAAKAVHGTPLYMAPEQILGQDVDGRADIYAAGTMFYQMLVAELPLPEFKNKTDLLKHKILSRGNFFLKKPSEVNPAIDQEMDRIIGKATAFEPDQRYGSGRDFLGDLEQYQRQRRL
ncbi:MAG: serine/threonine protein kinase [Desulfobacterales bacterium]|nr:serine/threonine protein kinase [Desulfobacterales bacterium]